MLTPFHLAIQVRDLDEAREFYGNRLGLPQGRSSDQWIDYNLFGHQLVVHLNPRIGRDGQVNQMNNHVDGHGVPVPHFGVVLTLPDWEALAAKLRALDTQFIIEPYVRFKGQPGEQATLFFMDPSGNALEFKAFADIETQLFAV
ncbi:VOC family protein [Pseudohongiella sp. SYSU M77423]|uniref:VOC family protein n=1 Tax=unclassified Pseudohongiella TaxID=2629611 RepID=UPI000C3EFE06|nr:MULTISPECIES: VOC family protein [unclassified Pseudohongiella]MAY57302.1 glyoxalase [Gammaproteobacteria bacterium]MBJ53791.1 glyoxalase [Gammaproteobacteria bacterium]MDH7942313.1 VOC family protein [Pseudohongiella sp. SYSU M77423]HBN13588.1 glyoxalase [Pseudohongiella sp.]|tara:strand:+ start:69 stop:500 length:432 start_codon:yes stop_codon:yes gene_type:complete